MRLLPNIRFGTERYPERVARRLRATNLTAWTGAATFAAYSIAQFLDPTPGLWKAATANAISAAALAAVPLLHRFGPLVAPVGVIVSGYTGLFVVCALLGTATGMQMYFLVAASLFVLFVGTERILMISAVGALAAVLIVALEIFVPRTTGLQSDPTMFANFVGTAFGTSGMFAPDRVICAAPSGPCRSSCRARI